MQRVLTQTTIYLATQPPDFRKQIDGLVARIVDSFPEKVNEGVFIFLNRARNKAKIIFWHKNGFVMLYKRLEKGKFSVVASESGLVKLNAQPFEWFLNGYDWPMMSDFYSPDFDQLYP